MEPEALNEPARDIGRDSSETSSALLDHNSPTSPPPHRSVATRIRRKAHSTLHHHHDRHHPHGTHTKQVKKALAHPRQTLSRAPKEIANGGTKLAAREAQNDLPQSAFPLDMEEEFVKAWDELHDSIRDNEDDADKEEKMRRFRELEKKRNMLRVKWTLKRHVAHLEVVQLSRPKSWPDIRSFSRIDEDGRHEVDFSGWLEKTLAYCTADIASQYIDPWTKLPRATPMRFYSTTERLIAASSPWQEWMLAVVRIYRWEDPWKTFGWMSAYFFFWQLDMLAILFGGYIVVSTLHNYFYPNQDNIKRAIARARNDKAHAQQLSEIFEQHPDGSWVYPLVQRLGPKLQLQMFDLACLLEIIRNFYEWKYPMQTARSLLTMTTAILALTLLPTYVIVKGMTAGLALMFFFIFPISSRYPRYRLLVSPIRWLFLDIPDDVGWAIRCLKQQSHADQDPDNQVAHPLTDSSGAPLKKVATLTRADGTMVPIEEPLYDWTPREQIYTYDCSLNGRKGKLRVELTSLAFFPDNVTLTTPVEGEHNEPNAATLDLKSVVEIARAQPQKQFRMLDQVVRIPQDDEVRTGSVYLTDDCGCKWRFAGLNVPEEMVLVMRAVGAGGWRWVGGV